VLEHDRSLARNGVPAGSITRNQSTGNAPVTRPVSRSQQVGWLGEELVARWLQCYGWTIVAQRWRCRWGELDLIAVPLAVPQRQNQSFNPRPTPEASINLINSINVRQSLQPMQSLLFIEVKTRNAANWDADGALAISTQKQAKLWHAVRVFLSRHPQYSDAVCRFDVALVRCDRLQTAEREELTDDRLTDLTWPSRIDGQQPINVGGYQLRLNRYLEGAIEADG
jgi:putative endonuclease